MSNLFDENENTENAPETPKKNRKKASLKPRALDPRIMLSAAAAGFTAEDAEDCEVDAGFEIEGVLLESSEAELTQSVSDNGLFADQTEAVESVEISDTLSADVEPAQNSDFLTQGRFIAESDAISIVEGPENGNVTLNLSLIHI